MTWRGLYVALVFLSGLLVVGFAKAGDPHQWGVFLNRGERVQWQGVSCEAAARAMRCFAHGHGIVVLTDGKTATIKVAR